MKRPIGVTILAILAIIGGLVQLFGGLSFLGITALAVPGMGVGSLAGGLGVTAGTVMIVLSVLGIVFGIGALMLKSWSWTLGVVLYGVMLAANLILMFTAGLSTTLVVAAIIAAVVLAYLFAPSVRTAFGHEHTYRSSSHGGPVVHA